MGCSGNDSHSDQWGQGWLLGRHEPDEKRNIFEEF